MFARRFRSRTHACVLATTFLLFLVSDSTTSAQRGGGRGAVRSTSRSSVSRSVDVNRNVDGNVNRNVNVNRNRDIDVDRDIDFNRDVDIDRDVDVDIDRGCCYHGGWGTAAAVATTAAVTAAVVGSVVHSIPASCSTVVIHGFTYEQCGSTWYQPRISGGSTTYVVVNPPL
jgi:hypothetical protein